MGAELKRDGTMELKTRRRYFLRGATGYGLALLAIPRAVAQDLQPSIDSVVNASLTGDDMAPCSLVTVFGSVGAPERYAAMVPLPYSLDGRTYIKIVNSKTGVVFDQRQLFANSTQVNFHLSCDLNPGDYNIYIEHDGVLSEPHSIHLKSSGPGIFTLPPSFGRRIAAAIIYPTPGRQPRVVGLGNQVAGLQTYPLRPGDLVLFWTTGLPTTGPLQDGMPAPEAYDLKPYVEISVNGQQDLLADEGEHIVWHPAYVGTQQGGIIVPDVDTGILTLRLLVPPDATASAQVDLPVIGGPGPLGEGFERLPNNLISGFVNMIPRIENTGVFYTNLRNTATDEATVVESSTNTNYVGFIPGARSRQNKLEVIVEHSNEDSPYFMKTVDSFLINDDGPTPYSPDVLQFVVDATPTANFKFTKNPIIGEGDPYQFYWTESDDPMDMMNNYQVIWYNYLHALVGGQKV